MLSLKKSVLLLSVLSLVSGGTVSWTEFQHRQEELAEKELRANFFLSSKTLAPDAQYYMQRVDHFNGNLVNERFKQRFYEVDYSSGAKNAPMFVYIGGEGALYGSALKEEYMVGSMAQEFGAYAVALEHRYYGKSWPRDSQTTEALQYLNSQQALADLVQFIVAKRRSPSQPVIVFGCSYPGNLAAWMRLQFPHVVAGAIASSAPVRAELDFIAYDEMTTAGLPESCAADVRTSMRVTEEALYRELEQTIRLFGCGDRLSDVAKSDDEKAAFMYVLADAVAFAVQYNNPNSKNNFIEQLCTQVEGARLLDDPSTTNESVTVRASRETKIIAKFSDYIRASYRVTGATCSDQWMTTLGPETQSKSMRSWMYQCCENFGYWQSASRAEGKSTRSQSIDLQWHLRNCDRLFPLPPKRDDYGFEIIDEIPSTWPSTVGHETNGFFGGVDIVSRLSGASNIHFTNGSVDPWMALGVTRVPDAIKNTNKLTSHVIPGASHCADFGPVKNNGNAVSVAQAAIRDSINSFLQNQYSKKFTKDDFSNSVTKEQVRNIHQKSST